MDYCLVPENIVIEVGIELYHLKLINEVIFHIEENFYDDSNLPALFEILKVIEENQGKIYNYHFLKGFILIICGEMFEIKKKDPKKARNCYEKGYNLIVFFLQTCSTNKLQEYYQGLNVEIQNNIRIINNQFTAIENKKFFEHLNLISDKISKFFKINLFFNFLSFFNSYFNSLRSDLSGSCLLKCSFPSRR